MVFAVLCCMLPFAHKHTYLLAKFLDIELLGQTIYELGILIGIAKLPSREVTAPPALGIQLMGANLSGENCATVKLECYISPLIVFHILKSRLHFLFDELLLFLCFPFSYLGELIIY